MVSYKAHKYVTVNIAKNRMLRRRLNWQRLVISIGYSVIVNATTKRLSDKSVITVTRLPWSTSETNRNQPLRTKAYLLDRIIVWNGNLSVSWNILYRNYGWRHPEGYFTRRNRKRNKNSGFPIGWLFLKRAHPSAYVCRQFAIGWLLIHFSRPVSVPRCTRRPEIIGSNPGPVTGSDIGYGTKRICLK